MGRTMQTREIAELYTRLVDVPTTERDRALDQACAGDQAARERMARLFAIDDPAPPRAARIVRRLPASIGPYRIVRRIGEGGMGTVYEGEHPETGERYAIKLLADRAPDKNSRARFRREAQILERLHHPAITRIHAVGESRGRPYFAMELVSGVPVTAYALQVGQPERVELVATICDALHYAHEMGVIHRDLKPANVLVSADGQPNVLDFGIARSIDADSWQTLDGSVVGTAAYMSPEQSLGGEVDRRADIYSLGVLAHEILAGAHPADALTPRERHQALISGEGFPCQVEGSLGEVIASAMSLDPAQRPASAAALAEALRAAISD